MIALDTNIVVRLITEDDPEQVRRARALILEQGGLIQTTVLLESEWVLRSVYRYGRRDIASAFSVLLQTDTLAVEQSERFLLILDAYAGGMDFADAVHVACADDAEGFATFDEALARDARRRFPDCRVIFP